MKLLLGTPALLWWLSDDPRLGDKARARIADPRHVVLVSAVSLFEITQAIRLGTLEAEIRDILQAVEGGGCTWLDLRPEHLRMLRKLPPGPGRQDPFGPLLIAQAMAEQATLVSDDPEVPRVMMRFMRCGDAPER
ncbi:type II toxin-antitoxin system VapC family toxin [Methylobacterium terricola]|uniref:Type II toxin-antitoxin system VapC family toxin n=1 Tax=Methylobacterium terricola TaxID=2583531 RepID=A0A5C4LJX2_9HYPH|nr:type II toxin-antitoxin system VapC family toxin [Methylobacterium terricola]TNC13550.1 type II toxin-antitoxin system VapC family toxin [Methylobacterium terricola]